MNLYDQYIAKITKMQVIIHILALTTVMFLLSHHQTPTSLRYIPF